MEKKPIFNITELIEKSKADLVMVQCAEIVILNQIIREMAEEIVKLKEKGALK